MSVSRSPYSSTSLTHSPPAQREEDAQFRIETLSETKTTSKFPKIGEKRNQWSYLVLESACCGTSLPGKIMAQLFGEQSTRRLDPGPATQE